MLYPNAKVYFDGSHYIAIPHTTRKLKYRPKPVEEIIEVKDEKISEEITKESDSIQEETFIIPFEEVKGYYELPFKKDEKTANSIKNNAKSSKNIRKLTKKELFNELYRKYIDLPKRDRKKFIISEMQKYFKTDEVCKAYVENQFERKLRNLICRRVRMVRKANLIHFDYFVTFTYDDKKHTELSFKKKLSNALSHLQSRKGWKYMGVWEHAPKTNRLHFHGLFKIPNSTMPGELITINDYDKHLKKRQITYQNTYFNEKFGRSDFKAITPEELGSSLSYLMKYIEKTGERIVYSRGLYQYFISDILEDDIVTTIGQEDKKLLLFDNFYCLKEGELIGKVSEKVIEQMQKSN